ncbi:MAG TPA: ABC transporter substrate-binding protein [Solirubrobacteraceae bacterium]|nr:ABC transporter substrate-binding protein [Solirubrobacteraceae bacterium]
MTDSNFFSEDAERALTRRQVLRGAMTGGAMLSAGALIAACGGSSNGGNTAATSAPAGSGASTGTPKAGGVISVGATGGGAKDTIDAHLPTADTDIMRCWNLYEPIAVRPPSFGPLEMMVAESLEAEKGKADSWVVTVRHGIEFHNGKTVTPEDVIFSLQRILDPKNPKVGAASIGYIDIKNVKKISSNQVRIPLKFANAGFPDDIGQYFNAIVPVGYNPAKPVGTGAFMYESFTPGQQSVFKKFPNYWQSGKPYLDQLTIIDFTDDTARVNALLGGQVQAIDNLPTGQIAQVQGTSSLKVLISQTGEWQPFTMRVDQAPFNDVRVRQAFRLIVDRPQMVEQVLSGQGRIANDMYSPYDPAYASSLPQRKQDIEQAKSLLKQAGHSNLTVTLTTAPVFQGVVQAAEVFAQQASAAGVNVKLSKVDTGTFYGPNYLKWPFAQDFWATREYLPQVAQGSLPNSPFNETHWAFSGTQDAAEFTKLINEARGTVDQTKRNDLLRQAMTLEYNNGGYIIPYFSNQIDAYSAKLTGFVEAKSGFPLGNYWFKNVGFKA